MKVLTLENYSKAVQMIKDKGYDKHHAEKHAIDIFNIVEKHGYTVEFFIEALTKQ